MAPATKRAAKVKTVPSSEASIKVDNKYREEAVRDISIKSKKGLKIPNMSCWYVQYFSCEADGNRALAIVFNAVVRLRGAAEAARFMFLESSCSTPTVPVG